MSQHENSDKRVPIEKDNPSIVREESKCILCGACKSVCKFTSGVYGFYDLEKTHDTAVCTGCGQCSNVCPTCAITERKAWQKIENIIQTKEKIVVFQTAPSVRIALGEAFSLPYGSFVEGKMVALLKKLGASYVFDTTFGADLTIMEEAHELVEYIQEGKKEPMFTSCCPAWVRYAEIFHPTYLSQLSTSKSPIAMQASVIKTYFAEKKGIDPRQIISVAVTPCTAKKLEISRAEMCDAGLYHQENMRDTDYVITTRELAEWAKEKQIDFASLEDATYDSILGKGTGAGVIFGASGGVMEAALREAHYLLTGTLPTESLLNLTSVRGLDGVKEATIEIGDTHLKVAVISGTKKAGRFLEKMKEENLTYDFVEVMACPGGCMAGGGQPKYDRVRMDEILSERMQALYQNDQVLPLRTSHQNPDIIALYRDFLEKPGSEMANQLLHTTYENRSSILGTELVKQ